MAVDAPAPPPRTRRRWLPAALIASCGLLLAGAVILLVVARRVPPAIEHALSDALRMPVRIEGLAIHPLAGSVSVGPVRLGGEGDVLGAARITITPRVTTLWGPDIIIDRVAIDEVSGVLHLDEHYQPVFRSVMTGERAEGTGTYHVTVRELLVAGGALTVRYPVGSKPRDGTLEVTRLQATNLDFGRVAGPALTMSAAFDGAFDGAPIRAATDVRLSGDHPGVTFDFAVTGLRVNRDLVSLPPELATLTGTVDVRAQLEAGEVSTQPALLLDVRVSDAELTGKDGTRVSAKNVAIPAARLDLTEQTADIGTVNVEAPVLTVRLSDGGVLLPITPPDGTGTSAWRVTSGDFVARGGTLQVLRRETTTSMTIAALRWDGLRPHSPGAFELDATIADGTLAASGTVTPDPPAVALEARLNDVPLPTVAQVVETLPVTLARGTASGHVRLRYRHGLEELAGNLALRDVATAPPTPEHVTQVLAVGAADAEFALVGGPNPELNISSLSLRYPYIMVERHPDGVFPWHLLGSPPNSSRPADRLPGVRIERADIEGGKIEFLDWTMEPPFWTALAHLKIEAEQARFPEQTVGAFRLAAKHNELSPTVVTGAVTERGLEATAELEDVLLESLNTYVAPALGYRFTAGRLSTTATATPAPPLLKSTAEVVLRGIELEQTGRDVIQEQSGVPLPIALHLIADLSGKIRLTLPLAIDTQFQTVSFGSVFWQAVRQTLVGALTSPVRLLGSLFGKKGAPHAFAIDPIPFVEGSATLDAAGRERIDAIERILKAHSGLTLILLPQVTEREMDAAGAEAASALAAARNAAVRDAFVGATVDPLPPDRVILAPWKADTAAHATGTPGVYVELQDAS